MKRIGKYTLHPEYKFCLDRKWRFDYAIPELKVAIEIEGGLFIKGGGRHNRAAGYIRDLEKYNRAAILGWKVLRYTTEQFNRYMFLKDLDEITGV